MTKNITNLVRGTVLARHWIRGARIRSLFSLMFSLILVMPNATPFVQVVSAAPGNFSIDFTAAAPLSYNHLTGGGAFDDGTIGVENDVVESLEGGNFSCGDIATYFAVVTVDGTQQAATDVSQTIEMNLSFLADTTGQSGTALGDIVNVSVNYGTIQDLIAGEDNIDSGISDDGGSVATLINETLTGPLFQSGSLLLGTVELTDLEAGEQVVVRIDVKLLCDPGSNPTGNLQADLQDAWLTYINGTTPVTPPQAISVGEQTIPFQKIGDIGTPGIAIQKTVTTADGTCPGAESMTVNKSETFKYCYVVANPGTAPLYNVTVIDDASTPSDLVDDFNVTLSGLTDIDLDGTADDLAAKANATGTKLFYYSTAGTFINTAKATGVDSNIQPTVISDNDTATVIIEVVPNPAYTINKIVTDVAGNGSEASATKSGDVISYQINITNTGNVDLTNITVNDTLIADANITGPAGDNVPVDVLNVGESWIFTGTYTVTQTDINTNGGGDGLINNTATVDSDQLGPKSDSAEVPVEEVPIEENPAYTIEKTVTNVAGKGASANVTKAGDIISYRINVNNTGNVDLTNVTVTDPLIGTLTGPDGDSNDPGILNVAESWIFTGTYTVTQADINNNGGGDGFINNTATVDLDQLGPKSDSAGVPIEEVPIEEVPIEENPAYNIKKIVLDVEGKGASANVIKAGDVISYQINITNTGNVDLTNITVTDPLLGNLAGPAGDNSVTGILEIGETWTYNGTYKATQADINTNGGGDGDIDNTATVDSDELEPESDTAQVPIARTPAYAIEKTVKDVAGNGASANITKAGEVITYQINVTNTGNVDLKNVTVTDPLIGTLNGPKGDSNNPAVLNVGETWIFTGNYKVTQADINTNGGGDGFINNTATVDSDQLGPKSDSAEVPIDQKLEKPDYCIYKSIIGVDKAGDCIINEPGDIIEYQIVVKNIGKVNLTNVTVNDSLITLKGPTGDNIDPRVLNPGETWKYTGNYTVTKADINSNGGGDGDIDNTATVSSNELPDESSSKEQPITRTPDYCIYKSIIEADRAGDCIINEPGDIIEYQIAVKNEGNADLTGVSVNDTLITLKGPTGDNIDPGVLNPGETWKYTGNYTVTKADINSNGGGDGDIDNTATVSSNELPDESSSKEQPIVQKLDLCIYKSIIGVDKAGDCIINEPGDIIEYQIAVKNNGKANLTGVSVNDTLITLKGPNGDNTDPGVLNPGETWKYTGNYTVTKADINSNGGGDGDIDNTATVSSNELPDESSSVQQPIAQTPDYCIYKSIIGVDRAGDCIINEPGDIIEYQIAVKNEGNADLTGVSVNDKLIKLKGPTGDNIEPGVLNPGETWKYTGNYTVTKADINSNGGGDGDLDNTATVSSNELPDESSSKEQPILLTQISAKNADSNPTPTNDVDQNGDDDSGDSGSSGESGGGGGGSPEPARNVEVKELAQAFIIKGKEAKFDFTRNVTCVVYVSFDARRNLGKTTTTVEMLKGKSALVSKPPAGEVCEFFNIWVGKGGIATSKNIENSAVCFKVEKAWMEKKDINESSITLKRYSDGKWDYLPTSLLDEDDKFLYFTAETSGFSPFAITGETKNDLDASMRGMQSESDTNNSGEDTGLETTEDTNSETEQKGSLSTPGFELVYGIVFLLAIFLYKRK